MMAWGLFGYGTGFAVAMVLLAQHLREQGLGIAGHESFWDWAMPVAWFIGPVSQFVNIVAGVFDDSGGIDGCTRSGSRWERCSLRRRCS